MHLKIGLLVPMEKSGASKQGMALGIEHKSLNPSHALKGVDWPPHFKLCDRGIFMSGDACI